jgi:hypothetical protein
LVKHALYAKDAWNSLRSVYLPRNSHCIQALTNDITTFHLTPGLDLREWIDGIEILYNDLCDLDSEAMSDRTFVLTILANISASSKWQEFGSRLRDCLAEYDNHEPNPICVTPTDFIFRIREKHWFCGKSKSQIVAAEMFLFSARTSKDRGGLKHSLGQEPTSLPLTQAQRACTSNDKPAATPTVAKRRAIPFKNVWHLGEEIRASMRRGEKACGTSTSHLINVAEPTTYHPPPIPHTRNPLPQRPRQLCITLLTNTTPSHVSTLPLTPPPPMTKLSLMQPLYMKLLHTTEARIWMVTSLLPASPS